MPAQLLALTDGPSILLDKPILLLGRHPECDIQLNSRKVSRRHCCIAQVRDYLVVRDLGSTNGIRINGDRVLEGKLVAGDELTVGNFKYQLSLDSPGEGLDLSSPPSKRRKPNRLFESSDEPVALDDHLSLSRVLDGLPAEPSSPPVRSTAKGPQGADGASILPSNLDLLPPSGSMPRPG
ncbi:MAG: FHA domain-containing protein [Planctomycetes bacterium]|nr:FHA domain-containing protein [Planctomycetota bacterium]